MLSYSEKMLAALKDEDLGEANLLFEEALKMTNQKYWQV